MNAKELKLLFIGSLILFSSSSSLAQNKFNSRLFYVKPPLYNSKSKVTNPFLSRYDFYDLSKRMFKFFLVGALVFYARKNPTYQLIAHSIDHAHFVFPFGYFSLVEQF